MDGLEDGEEEALGTDPLDPDTDGDTISDGDEVDGTNGFVTDPKLPDTDGDGWNDAFEVMRGSDPTDINSVPPPSSLPIIDDFEDGDLDPIDWMTSTPEGGAVTETGGHLTMTSRGYLTTVGEFDPELVGGLCITGEWTFVAGDDFIQILTRTDGVEDPDNCCGETNSGVEFYASDPNETVTIRARNGDHTVENVVQTGAITVNQGTTYLFTVIDDGLGALSFALEEKDNPANATLITATLAADTSDRNHVTFHNREGGRTSQLEHVTIKSLVPQTSGFQITNITYDDNGTPFDRGDDTISLTWPSTEGEFYGIFYTTDLGDWEIDLDDAYEGDPGESTTYTFPATDISDPVPDRVFFRIEQ